MILSFKSSCNSTLYKTKSRPIYGWYLGYLLIQTSHVVYDQNICRYEIPNNK